MARRKYTEINVKNIRANRFDVHITTARCTVTIKLEGEVPHLDTDLLKAVVDWHTSNKGVNVISGKLRLALEHMLAMHEECFIRGRKWSYGVIAKTIKGEPLEIDEWPEGHPKPIVRNWVETRHTKFETFNGGPHLCVEVPDGHFTISCATSEGKKITFAFLPYRQNGPAQCVDVQHHTSGVVKMNGDHPCPVQEIRAFGVGPTLFHNSLKDKEPCTFTTVLLRTKEELEAEEKRA